MNGAGKLSLLLVRSYAVGFSIATVIPSEVEESGCETLDRATGSFEFAQDHLVHWPSTPSTGSFAFFHASQLPGTFHNSLNPCGFKMLVAMLAR